MITLDVGIGRCGEKEGNVKTDWEESFGGEHAGFCKEKVRWIQRRKRENRRKAAASDAFKESVDMNKGG